MNISETDAQPLIQYLRSPIAIRERSQQLFELACQDRLAHFRCQLDRLPIAASYVLQVIKAQYPHLDIPFHSRWRHFEVGATPRLMTLQQKLASLSPLEQAKTKIDLAVTSVLLDAGAGAQWQYQEPASREIFRRSEGLAVASFDLFCQGAFSSNPDFPYQADGAGLEQLTESALAAGFQVSATNPLVGLTGRLELLQQLGRSLTQYPHLFGASAPRPGNLVLHLVEQADNGKLAAATVLSAVLEGLTDIWPGRSVLSGVNLGDVWPHPAIQSSQPGDQFVPFHKLSQWLTYSLLEPLQELGLEITELNELTGLPEYRNGGLCLDLGLLEAKQEEIYQQPHSPGSAVIVEWRALTVCLLDQIATEIRSQLNQSTEELPLAKVLQGGTWTAGRQIASELRAGGVPPLAIESDGTVF